MPNIKSCDELIEMVKNYNIILSKRHKTTFGKDVTDSMYQKCVENDFYFGLFNHSTTTEYGYEWAKKLVEHYTGETIKTYKQLKKPTVPKKIKNDSWDKYVGPEYGSALCIVCNKTTIDSKHFEAGHIISHNNGGPSTIENIMPICGCCNKSMQNINMDEYIQTYNPTQLTAFIKRDYTHKNIPKKGFFF
jgi:hypothetical protein